MSALETIKRSVDTHSMIRYKKQKIDAFSASAILNVHKQLREDQQKKYEEIMEVDLIRAASIAFKLTGSK